MRQALRRKGRFPGVSPLLIPLAGALVLAVLWAGVSMRLTAERAEALRAAQQRATALAHLLAALAVHAPSAFDDADVVATWVEHDGDAVATLGQRGFAALYLCDGTPLADHPRGAATRAVASDVSIPPSLVGGTGTDVNAEVSAANVATAAIAGTSLLARRAVPGYPLHVAVRLDPDDVLAPYRKMRSVYLLGTTALSASIALLIAAITTLVRRLLASRNRLRVLARTDALTGLYNRHGILARLRQQLIRQGAPGCVAVVYLDLGNLKQVNDALGHEAGDQVLQKMAQRLQACLAPYDVGRCGGDEFLAIVTVGSETGSKTGKKSGSEMPPVYAAARNAVDAIVVLFESAVVLRGHVFALRGSIGMAVHARSEDGVSTLVREADEAMYAAKAQMARLHRTTWCVYSNAMRARGRRRVAADQQLRNALHDGGVNLVFHPVRATDRSAWTDGFLVRVAPQGGSRTRPAWQDVSSACAANGLQSAVTEYVLTMLCGTVQSWERRGLAIAQMVYVLEKGVFLDVDCAQIVVDATRGTVLRDGVLVLEVPESAFADEPALASMRAAALRRVGVRLLLGTFSGSFAAFALLETGPFFGLALRRSIGVADIVLATVERVIGLGRMVLISRPLLPTSVPPHPLVSVVDCADAYCAATAAQRLPWRPVTA